MRHFRLTVFLLAAALCAALWFFPLTVAEAHSDSRNLELVTAHAKKLLARGQHVFRFDTFGDEAFWGGSLKLHQAIAGAKFGGVGPGLSPAAALKLGLKVDVEALPKQLLRAIERRAINLDDPANTLALLRLNAVVGVTGFFEGSRLSSVGVQCSLCHSVVDNSVAPGIGKRRDGWPNRDLDIGAIMALAPDVSPLTNLLGVDEATVRGVLNSWGPGRFDASLLLDGKAVRPDGKPAAVMIPAAFGLAGVNLHTYTGWGGVSHWNALVANVEMQGQGTFYDPRLNDPDRFPVAARAGFGDIRAENDRITSKLPALQFYQLALDAPKPVRGSFNAASAKIGERVFNGRAGCARCHVPPLFTEPGWNMHAPSEIGIDAFQAERGPEGGYRTTPLRGLFTRLNGGFYHDGRFKTYDAVVDHYNRVFGLKLTTAERRDLVEYLKSL